MHMENHEFKKAQAEYRKVKIWMNDQNARNAAAAHNARMAEMFKEIDANETRCDQKSNSEDDLSGRRSKWSAAIIDA